MPNQMPSPPRRGLFVLIATCAFLTCSGTKPDGDCEGPQAETLGKSPRSLLQAVVVTGRQDDPGLPPQEMPAMSTPIASEAGGISEEHAVPSNQRLLEAGGIREEHAVPSNQSLVEERDDQAAPKGAALLFRNGHAGSADEVLVQERSGAIATGEDQAVGAGPALQFRNEHAGHPDEVLVEERQAAGEGLALLFSSERAGRPGEVLVEERRSWRERGREQATVVAEDSGDDNIPVVRHARVDGDAAAADASGYQSIWWFLLTDETASMVMLSLLFLLLFICLLSFCCLKYQHPDVERLSLKPNPRLVHKTVVTHQVAVGEAQPARPLHVHYKEGAERVFTIRGLQTAALDNWCKTENNIVDSAGRLVLKSFVMVPQRVDWYQQWYWHWQREGLADVWRATPFGRLMGVGVKEHPTIALHSPPGPDQDPRAVGPVFACCRAAPPPQGGEVPESTCQYFYDADDHLFASMARSGYLGTYEYVVSASGIRLTFSGSFPTHDILVTDSRGEQVAVVQQATKEQDPSRQCYNVRILPAVEWSTIIIVLIALQAIEVEELVTSSNQAAAAAAAASPSAGSQPNVAVATMPPQQSVKSLPAMGSMSAIPS